MLLAVDAGNTNITFGIFDGKDLIGTFRMMTKEQRTSDEYGIMIKELVMQYKIKADQITNVIVASVVPVIMHSLSSAFIKYFGIRPMIVSAGTKTGVRIAIENPKQAGADRIVNVAAGYILHGGPVLVIDYGTATTYDLVGPDGAFEAGITAPGIRISAEAMANQAAMLPAIEIVKPPSILSKETIPSMQAGLVYGQIGQTEYIVKQIEKESGYHGIKVVATGGLGSIIASETPVIDIYDARLTLKGLQIIFEKNSK